MLESSKTMLQNKHVRFLCDTKRIRVILPDSFNGKLISLVMVHFYHLYILLWYGELSI